MLFRRRGGGEGERRALRRGGEGERRKFFGGEGERRKLEEDTEVCFFRAVFLHISNAENMRKRHREFPLKLSPLVVLLPPPLSLLLVPVPGEVAEVSEPVPVPVVPVVIDSDSVLQVQQVVRGDTPGVVGVPQLVGDGAVAAPPAAVLTGLGLLPGGPAMILAPNFM